MLTNLSYIDLVYILLFLNIYYIFKFQYKFNFYGFYLYYMVLEDEGNVYGVLLQNSNGMGKVII